MPETCPVCRQLSVIEAGQPAGTGLLSNRCQTCGYFSFTLSAAAVLGALKDQERLALILAARQGSEAGAPLTIDSYSLPGILAGAPHPATLSEGIDNVLLILAKRATSFMGVVPFNKDNDYALVRARSAKGMNEFIVAGIELGLLKSAAGGACITVAGWKRIDELRLIQLDSRQAFVAMWFDPTLDDAWENGFKIGIERSRYFRAIRVDSVEHNGKVDDRIVAEIRRSGLLVADFTGNRGGVYFEAGLALGEHIPVIWTCREDAVADLHFDTRQYNHIVWRGPSDLANRLDARIAATLLPRGWVTTQ